MIKVEAVVIRERIETVIDAISAKLLNVEIVVVRPSGTRVRTILVGV